MRVRGAQGTTMHHGFCPCSESFPRAVAPARALESSVCSRSGGHPPSHGRDFPGFCYRGCGAGEAACSSHDPGDARGCIRLLRPTVYRSGAQECTACLGLFQFAHTPPDQRARGDALGRHPEWAVPVASGRARQNHPWHTRKAAPCQSLPGTEETSRWLIQRLTSSTVTTLTPPPAEPVGAPYRSRYGPAPPAVHACRRSRCCSATDAPAHIGREQGQRRRRHLSMPP
jgi:hypothetical protein